MASLPNLIIPWYTENKRDLPWREDKAPYHIWLSEIMLQQTRVTTVIPYYQRFLATLPTIDELAAANEELLHKLWEGLGYYSRVRNMQKTANLIIREHGGIFPCEYEQILKLPGIGPYTAGAIASICFDEPVPAVDGNVLRLIARLNGLTDDISLPIVKKNIQESLMQICPKANPGDFNQGLIELGATICIPNGKPNCENCPLIDICKAFQNKTTTEIPVKKPKKAQKCQEITVFLFAYKDKVAIRKREEKGLLAGLWEFPNHPGFHTPEQILSLAEEWGVQPEGIAEITEKTHLFTHIKWKMRFYLIPCKKHPESFIWENRETLREQYAIPAAFQLPELR